MKNQVGREIPDEILARMGKTGYRGLHDRDNASYRKASPTVRALNDPQRGKLCASLREALEKCELHDGMYFGFHHHFRDGDYVINMVMQEVARMGIRDITICATSMGAAHDALEPLIKQGVIAGIQSLRRSRQDRRGHFQGKIQKAGDHSLARRSCPRD